MSKTEAGASQVDDELGPLLTPDQAAPLVGMSAYSLKTLARKKQIDHLRVGPNGGLIRFRRDQLRDYLESCRQLGQDAPKSSKKTRPKKQTQRAVPAKLKAGSLLGMLDD
jgi:excisionase family DNA binding protein